MCLALSSFSYLSPPGVSAELAPRSGVTYHGATAYAATASGATAAGATAAAATVAATGTDVPVGMSRDAGPAWLGGGAGGGGLLIGAIQKLSLRLRSLRQ